MSIYTGMTQNCTSEVVYLSDWPGYGFGPTCRNFLVGLRTSVLKRDIITDRHVHCQMKLSEDLVLEFHIAGAGFVTLTIDENADNGGSWFKSRSRTNSHGDQLLSNCFNASTKLSNIGSVEAALQEENTGVSLLVW